MEYNPYQKLGKPVKCSKCGISRGLAWVSISRENKPVEADRICLCLRCKKEFVRLIDSYKASIAGVARELEKKRQELGKTEEAAEKADRKKETALVEEDIAKTNRIRREEAIKTLEKDFESRKAEQNKIIFEKVARSEKLDKEISAKSSELKKIAGEAEKETEHRDAIAFQRGRENTELSILKKSRKESEELYAEMEKKLVSLLREISQVEKAAEEARKIIKTAQEKIDEQKEKEAWVVYFEGRVNAYYEYIGKKLPDYKKFKT